MLITSDGLLLHSPRTVVVAAAAAAAAVFFEKRSRRGAKKHIFGMKHMQFPVFFPWVMFLGHWFPFACQG